MSSHEGTFEPVSTFESACFRLARLSLAQHKGLRGALREVAEIAAVALNVGRISVWGFLNGRQSIRCDFLYQPDHPVIAEGAILHRADLELYFRAIEQRRVVPVNDVADDPISDQFRVSYFEPLGIRAMLDAPVYEDGQVTAIVCHEHLLTPRRWKTDEAQFVAVVGDTVARLRSEARLASARNDLGTFRRQVDQLHHLGALGRLAAGMAHDFANVLVATQGSAQLITSYCEPTSKIAALARDIVAASERGRGLVESLMRLGRPSPSNPRVSDIAVLLTAAEPLLRMAAGPSVALDVVAQPGMARVLIDATDLERALVNLVVNARDAMPAGGTIRCTAFETPVEPTGDDPAYVTVEVADEGEGMDATTLSRIFEPFFSTKAGAGSGLGLSIVRQIVVLAGGLVEAESTPGRGTTIRLRLPAIGRAESSPNPAPEPRSRTP